MALPKDEWLAQAKRCAINQTRRVRHKNEPTDAMTVGNEGDRYWAYCQRCKQGGVDMKSHVVLGTRAPKESADMTMPTDMVQLSKAEPHIQQGVGTFLATKNMDLMYLPQDTYFSESRSRLIIGTDLKYMGRDTTGKSPQKWLTYNRQTYIQVPRDVPYNGYAVLTEDTFSAYKVAHAVGEDITVFCTLGTEISTELMLTLIRKYCRVFSYYDGDNAGWQGATNNGKRLRALSIGSNYIATEQCAPAGLDPKDQTLSAIREHVLRNLYY